MVAKKYTLNFIIQDLVGAARDDNMTVVQYILENHKADVNSRQQDRVYSLVFLYN